MSNRKQIAVLATQVDSKYQKSIMEGLLDEAFRLDMDVLVFATFFRIGNPDIHADGEFNIFNCINAKTADAFIILSDTIRESGRLDGIIDHVKSVAGDKPIYSIDYDYEGVKYITTDDSDEVERVIDHLIECHGCKKINYLTGFKGHPHSESRREGYKRSLEKHGIPYEEERVEYGNFWHDYMDEYIDKLESAPDGMPDAVGCVSDHNAIYLADYLARRGYRIPEDIKIVGFDYIGEVSENFGNATSITKSFEYAARNTVRHVYEDLTGKKAEGDITVRETPLIIGGTCGCVSEPTAYIPETGLGLYEDDNDFYSGYNLMLETLISRMDTKEFFWGVDWYRTYIDGFDGLYFCLNTDWEGYGDAEDVMYRKVGYSDKMYQIFYREGEISNVDYKTFDSDTLLPDLYVERDKPAVYYFLPSHFDDRSLGYCVLKYVNRPVVFKVEFASWMKYVDIALESLRRHNLLKKLNFELEEMNRKIEKEAITDMLTGIYNRNTYGRYCYEMRQKALADGSDMFVLFADLNNLKYINDTYGHDKGDDAIVAAASAIESACTGNERCFRIGGDEFVIVGCGNYSEASIKSHYKAILDKLEVYNRRSSNEYNILISLGAVATKCSYLEPVEKILSEADKIMIEEKKRVKNSPEYMDMLLKK